MRLSRKQAIDYWLGGAAILALRPLTRGVGLLLRRDHDPIPRGPITVLKILGGGSLVLAAQALLGIRKAYPGLPLRLITTRSVEPFARSLDLFDHVILLDDTSLPRLFANVPALLRGLRGSDTVIDLEPYSRLSTVAATISCARNRHGFYLESMFWRRGMATHLTFFNRFGSVVSPYNAICTSLGAVAASRRDLAVNVATRLGIPIEPDSPSQRVTLRTDAHRFCLGPSCSEFARERMMSTDQWIRVLPACLPAGTTEVVILGGRGDGEFAEALIRAGTRLGDLRWVNACDGRDLGDSLRVLAGCGGFAGVDSGLLHYARLFGVPDLSFWGPTAPHTRASEEESGLSKVYYARTPCSPCVHVAEAPPCGGRNLCMEAAVLAVEDRDKAAAYARSVPMPGWPRSGSHHR